MSTAPLLEEKIQQQKTLKRNVVVSLTDASFIDSTVIATILRGHRELGETGVRLVLHTTCDAAIQKLVQITGISNAIPCAEELDQAVQMARGDIR